VYSETTGGTGGLPFDDTGRLLNNILCDIRVEEVQIRSGSAIDQIKLKIGDGKNSYWSDIRGGNGGGGPYSFVVPLGENIISVLIRSGSSIDSLQFITDKGTVSQQFGGNGGTLRSYNLTGRLIGFFGRNGAIIDQIGLISLK